ncbi:MAG: hypothetical protein AB8V23_04640 [Candidatus Midichloria sp.]
MQALLYVCSNEPVEVATAAVLPCFWVYNEVGLSIARYASADNPYARWIESYSSLLPRLKKLTIYLICWHRKLAKRLEKRCSMLVINHTCLEWHF